MWRVSLAGQAPEPLDIQGQAWQFSLGSTIYTSKALTPAALALPASLGGCR